MTLQARLDRLPWSRYQWQVAGTLAFCFAFELADINSFAYAAPAVHHALRVGFRAVSVVTAAGFLGMFTGAALGGRLAERFGRRRGLRASVVWFSVCSLANAAAFDATTLTAARFLTGCGLGAMTVVAVTYLAELVPANQRGRLQASTLAAGLPGIPAMAFSARAVIGLGPQGWRLIFVFGALGLVPLVITRWLPESPAWLLAHGRAAEAADAVAAIEGRVGRPLPPVVVAAPVPVPPRLRARLLFFGPLGRRTVLLMTVWVLLTISYYGFASFAPALLHDHGFTLTHSVGYTALTTLGAVPGALLAWPVADRFGMRGPITVLSLLFAGSGVAYGLTFAPTAIVVFGFLVAALNQALVALMYSYTPRLFPVEIRATATGICYGAGRLLNAFGPLVVGQIYLTLGYTPVFVFVGACGALIAVSVLALAPRRAALAPVAEPAPSPA
ncbi:MFS transporter [Amycolatopsis sp. FDAARGOS 1241]|uniref:MFS transporter n=1 Tax=Amycolatopsis sp. FDAARGOS 1241 TaxID=2778070 RepID=UPI0019516549|nr:MFS transporter [Amycolatopsis sp. FDAARGOS 1241]QRP43516.1 MFS transporter [Amycolatopsis sp. FDAARGOS 1241]